MTESKKEAVSLNTHELLMSEGIEHRIQQLTAAMMCPESDISPIDVSSVLVVAASKALNFINEPETAAMFTQLIIEAAASSEILRYVNESLKGNNAELDKTVRQLSDKLTAAEFDLSGCEIGKDEIGNALKQCESKDQPIEEAEISE